MSPDGAGKEWRTFPSGAEVHLEIAPGILDKKGETQAQWVDPPLPAEHRAGTSQRPHWPQDPEPHPSAWGTGDASSPAVC